LADRDIDMAMPLASSPQAPDRGPPPAPTLLRQLLAAQPPRTAAGHRRVGAMSRLLARRLGLDPGTAAAIGRAGALRDIGMVLVPASISGREESQLSLRDRALVHRHSACGHEVLELTGDPDLALAATVALQHHERWDGSGYPSGLRGEQICLAARIVGICALYDALRHSRPGGAPLDHFAALAVLRAGDRDTGPDAFDPELRKLFFLFHDDFRRIAGEGSRLALAA